MRIHPGIRELARWGRAVLLPIGSVNRHLRYLVVKTGKELHFEPEVFQKLEMDSKATLHEIGIDE